MSKNKSSKVVDTIIDFALIVAISFVIFSLAIYLGAPLWLSLIIVALWGAFTGYKPKALRKTFSFLYKDEE
ncbi:hypothetical protein ACKGJI_08405 [Sulfurospirillum sp. 1307]|jgi:hypothetical protein